ncbi:MAG: NAD(P)/FAD-dependent oxidoreductase [Gemmatimonadetes bacterium]|nr:NAD(P)/FAD-dependent oxidoreductase [Gemmatimonadota bacterium]
MASSDLVYSEASPRRVRQLRPGDHIAVVGGGPAGLTTAYLLAQRGYDVTVFEGDDILGGISQTAQYKGFRFDIGGHRFFTKIEPVEALWHEILEDEFISVPRLSRIHYRGKYFNYPLKPANALFGLGLFNSIGIILSYLWWHFRPYPVEENFEQWVTNRFGKRLYEIFFKTYTEKVWGIPCTEIRAEWAAQRIKGLSLARAIISAASINKRSTKIKTLINEFQYPRLGPGQMWEVCADKIRGMGGRVLLEHYVEGILVEDGEAKAVRVRNAAGVEEVACDHVVSTMPLRTLARSLEPAPSAEVREAADGLRYRDFLVVALIMDGEDLFPDNWIYVHTPGVKVGRFQNFNNWSQAMVPEPGKTCLGLEYFCFEGDGLWTSSDEDLIARATRELAELGVAKGATVEDGAVIRMPKAYPIYDAIYSECVDTLRSHIDPIANLHTVGRNGMHKYNNADHSMLTAMMAIWNMEGAGHDLWAVNTDFEYHEEQRLEAGQSTEASPPDAEADGGASAGAEQAAAAAHSEVEPPSRGSSSGIAARADGTA